MLRRLVGVSLLRATSNPRACARYLPGASFSRNVNAHLLVPAARNMTGLRQLRDGVRADRLGRRTKRQLSSVPLTLASDTCTRSTPEAQAPLASADRPLRVTLPAASFTPLRLSVVSGLSASRQSLDGVWRWSSTGGLGSVRFCPSWCCSVGWPSSRGGGADPSSKAPMSQAPPTGRANPRWSSAGQSTVVPASIAGLPASSACVSVGPPLSATGASFGSAFRSPGALNAHDAPSSRLWPPEVGVPRQLAWSVAWLPETIELRTVMGISSAVTMPPPRYAAVLSAIVLLSSVKDVSGLNCWLSMAPPDDDSAAT